MVLGPEQTIAALGILALSVAAIYGCFCWIREAPLTPDPWDGHTDEAVNTQAAVPVCHHCLTPQEHNGWFCPKCGATVGPYCNYMPYIYVFSQGEVLRAGVNERLRHNALITVGYVLFSLGMFAFAAPIYWFFLFRNLWRTEESPPETAAA